MNESGWLMSDSPAAMLHALRKGGGLPLAGEPFQVGDRKLRLWVEACRREEERFKGRELYGHWPDLTVRRYLDESVGAWSGTVGDEEVPMAMRAALLREVVGNPFRPVELPGPPCPDCPPGSPDENCDDCGGEGTILGPCPWVTPNVTALARQAYEERGGTVCVRCGGNPVSTDAGGDTFCPDCNGAGRVVTTGHLDPVRLSVLADELAESGCCDAALLGHLRSREPCHNLPADPADVTFHADHCGVCDGTGWLALRGPHCRGCWAVDLILGLEQSP